MFADQTAGAGASLAEAAFRYEPSMPVDVPGQLGRIRLAAETRKHDSKGVAMTNIASLGASKPQVAADAALRIARLDAEKKYRDLSLYRIAIVFEDNHWRIDYELRNPDVQGGGPHYLIDAVTGAILSRRYGQ